MRYSVQTSGSLDSAVSAAIQRGAASLLRRQHSEGFWWADLTADSTLESDYILGELWLHPPVDGVWNPPTRGKIDRAVASFLARQLEDGGFNIYHKGPSEISASVKAYFALKVAGVSTRGSAHAEVARPHSRDGWRAGREQLRTHQSKLVWVVSSRSNRRRFHPKSFCSRSTSSIRCRPGRARS